MGLNDRKWSGLMPREAAAKLTTLGSFRNEQPSVWDFPQHGVTSSFLNSFVTCMEQTRLHYVEGYQSRRVPMAFEFGTCGHWVLEQAYTMLMKKNGKIKGFIGPKLVEGWLRKYHELWMKQVENPTQYQLDQQEEAYGMAQPLLEGYFKRWDGDFNGNKYKYTSSTVKPATWISLEEIFCVPYVYPDGLIVPLRGRRDGVFSGKDGRVWVFDTKCRSVINESDSLATLPFDLQQMFYLYITKRQMALSKKRSEIKRAYPSGTVMNILRRPGQRWGKNDNLQTFLSRVAKDIQPKRYDHYFIRYQMTVGTNELDRWVKEFLDPVMMQVRLWWEGKVPHYLNPNSLISKYGRCGLFNGITAGDFTECYKRPIPFNELADAA